VTKAGFTLHKVSNSVAKNETWKHSDGSQVLLHLYGNEDEGGYKSGNNAHMHKVAPNGSKLDDKGHPCAANSAEAHIGLSNPPDLPTVRGRAHGAGSK
jgi:hypothetical protein